MRSRTPLFRSALLAVAVLATLGCNIEDPSQPSVPANETYAASLNVNLATMTKISDDLYIKDLVVGSGVTATAGRTITVTYTGWLVDGTQFDSNVGKTPAVFLLGDENLITGWNLGIPGMKVGGRRQLVIGSSYGYGATGRGPVPGHATLVFDVQLTAVQ